MHNIGIHIEIKNHRTSLKQKPKKSMYVWHLYKLHMVHLIDDVSSPLTLHRLIKAGCYPAITTSRYIFASTRFSTSRYGYYWLAVKYKNL